METPTTSRAAGDLGSQDPADEFVLSVDTGSHANVIGAFDALRDRGPPIQPIICDGKPAFAILGYDAVEQAYRNVVDLPGSHHFKAFTQPFFGYVVSTATEGEDHRFHRRQSLVPFKPASVRNHIEKTIRPVTDKLIDRFPVGQPFDFIEMFAEPGTFNVISSMLDLPEEDLAGFRSSIRQLLDLSNPEQAMAARNIVNPYLQSLIARRREKPGEDMISQLIAAETDGRRYTDEELLDAVRFFDPAAMHNTMNAVGLCIQAVLANPEVERRVRLNEKDRTAAIEESLRITPAILHSYRLTARPVMIEGVEIPADTPVLLMISSANRDPNHYPDPTTFSLDRQVTDHLTFGRGSRLCIGLWLARAELRVMLDQMLSRLVGLRLVPGSGDEPGGFFHGYRRLMMQFDQRLPTAA